MKRVQTHDSDKESVLFYQPFSASNITLTSPTLKLQIPQHIRSFKSDQASVEIVMVVTPGVKRPNLVCHIPANIIVIKKKKEKKNKKD